MTAHGHRIAAVTLSEDPIELVGLDARELVQDLDAAAWVGAHPPRGVRDEDTLEGCLVVAPREVDEASMRGRLPALGDLELVPQAEHRRLAEHAHVSHARLVDDDVTQIGLEEDTLDDLARAIERE